MTASIRVAIYGTGRLAGSLARALAAPGEPGGVELAGISGRNQHRCTLLAEALGKPVLPVADLRQHADLVVIAVADAAIRVVADELAATPAPGPAAPAPAPPTAPASAAPPTAPTSAMAAVHCAGALGPEVLAPLASAGWATATFHPLQAFPTATTAPAAGVTWTITADDPTLAAQLDRVTRALGGRPHPLAAAHRAGYHAAAVLAANYPAALVAHAVAVLTDCGFTEDEALAALLPLARSALDGLATAGVPGGLTGPAVRGDVATITSHLRALDVRPATQELYRAAGLAIVPFAQARGLPAGAVARLRTALTRSRDLP